MRMTFPMWLKSLDNPTAFEKWLIKVSTRHKIKRYRDFSHYIWQFAFRDGVENAHKPFCEIFTAKLAVLFDQYEARKKSR